VLADLINTTKSEVQRISRIPPDVPAVMRREKKNYNGEDSGVPLNFCFNSFLMLNFTKSRMKLNNYKVKACCQVAFPRRHRSRRGNRSFIVACQPDIRRVVNGVVR